MKLTDLNPHGGIGANCLLVELGPFRFLIDAGIHPKKVGRDTLPDFDKLAPNSIDALILTHCHLDHLGSLPVALRHQPEAMIILSRPTQELAVRMLRNSCNVMRRQREEQHIPEYPLYSYSELDRLEPMMFALPYGHARTFAKGNEEVQVTLYASGHIVGAAGVKLTYKHRSIFFTGDVLFTDQKTLPGASFPDETFDTLVMETTRGLTARTADKAREDEVARLLQTVGRTLENGGSVLIPAFALGRMQEILAILEEAVSKGDIPKVPVVCSGLGLDLVDYFDNISRKFNAVHFRRTILKKLGVQSLKRFPDPGKSPSRPTLFVVSSGMLVEKTPSYAVASSLLGNPHNAVCFVGYCDPDTPGGQLLETPRDESFVFDALDYVTPVRASIERFDLSGHADREELLEFAHHCEPRAIVLTHGDPEARAWFKEELEQSDQGYSVTDPVPGTCYTV
ncbi:MBL fold metallo-hydrolase [Ruficoccus amylovorans]|uniref:MBL fold metallo-hydrolase n=1 Tax=Ruficoccus amylovorans TaxID=1804625 RepID=A0A842HBC6_9BACT|nr:MBL fold metallo-hydrolase [Ruficoccus amylovorans]MBC2593580.1 MBL fold metallo-hydrolase [Ruficoccus amylovorans]